MARSSPRVVILAVATLVLASCYRFVKMQPDYQTVKPPESQLLAECTKLPSSDWDLAVQFSLREKKRRIQTEFIEGQPFLSNLGLWSAVMVSGVLFGASDPERHQVNESTYAGGGRRSLVGWTIGIAGTIGMFATLGGMKFPFGDWSSEKTTVFKESLHTFVRPLAERYLSVTSNWQPRERLAATNITGGLVLDMRDYLSKPPRDSGLVLSFESEGLHCQVVVTRAHIAEALSNEAAAETLLSRAESLENAGQLGPAAESLAHLVSRYPKSEAAGDAPSSAQRIRDLIRQKEEQEKQRRQAQAWARLQSVSLSSAQELMSQFSSDESDRLANALGQLSYRNAVTVMREGLGISGEDGPCNQAYRSLSLPQQLYAVLCYKDRLSDGAVGTLCSMLRISGATAERLVRTAPSSLTTR